MNRPEPHVVEIGDTIAPIDVFRALSNLPHPFFLDSTNQPGGRSGPAEYSIVGADPFATLVAQGDTTVERTGDVERTLHGDPFDTLDEVARVFATRPAAGLPFGGGLVGYLGYDLCRFVERLPRTVADDLEMPGMFFGVYDAAIVFEHATGRAFIVSTGLPERGTVGRERARARAHWLQALVTERTQAAADPSSTPDCARSRAEPAVKQTPRSNLTRGQYLAAVDRARDYIFAGDIYQVNLSQRFEAALQANPVSLYCALRDISPAPFGAYIDSGRFKILSNSPERFLHVNGRRVETRPIKGTLPRGETGALDRDLSARLLASEKDAAEHLMIVDLERNDLGRICEYGSVVVEELARLESFRHVHHLVSIISGRLQPGVTAAQLLRATFPGGSITGAPKVRAMEIIDELEPVARGVYTGAIGYLSSCGSVDLSIAIRTLVYDGATAYFQAGGGIVADSNPEAEYQETLDKARAFFDLLDANGAKAAVT